jgi:hypothetical protein
MDILQTFEPGKRVQAEAMKRMPIPSQSSLDALDASLDQPYGVSWPFSQGGSLELPTAALQPLPQVTTLQPARCAPKTHLDPFPHHPDPPCHPSTDLESGQLTIQLPPQPLNVATSDPPRQLLRDESGAMSTDDGGFSGGFTGGASGDFPGFSGDPSGIPAAPAMFMTPVAREVTQAAVLSWTLQEYSSSGALREMTCVEARVRFCTLHVRARLCLSDLCANVLHSHMCNRYCSLIAAVGGQSV